MALLKSSNPALREKSYEGTIFQGMDEAGQVMTLKGTMNKFGFLMLMLLGTTIFSWTYFYSGNNPVPMLITGVIGALALALIMAFKMEWSPYLSPAYALFKGLVVGTASAMYDYLYPGLPMQAVALTLLVALVMFLIYRYRIIKVTSRFRSIIIIATATLAVFYLIQFIAYFAFGSQIAAFTNASTPLGIGFSVVVVVLAALNLLLNFDTIEKGIEMKARKFMEWYSAFGLLVTIVWLYLEILRLLAKLRD